MRVLCDRVCLIVLDCVQVHFFTSADLTRKFKIPKEQVSNLIPDQFLERYVRVYLRDPDTEGKFEAAQAAVRYGMAMLPFIHSCASKQMVTVLTVLIMIIS